MKPGVILTPEEEADLERAAIQGETPEPVFLAPAHWQRFDLADLEIWPVEALRPVVDGILARGTLVSIAAPSQTAKTLFTIWLMRKILKHGKLFERYEITPVERIGYLVLEDPARRIQARMLDTAHEFEPIDRGRLVFHVAPSFSLIDERMFEWFESLITIDRLDIVVIDTYQKSTPGLSSFNDEQQSIILHRLANLTRKLGVTIIVLDHIRKADNKNGRGKRNELSIDDVKGSGGKVQNADAVILMERTPDKKQVKFQCFSKDFDQPVRILLDVAPKGSSGPKFTYAGDLEQLGQASSQKAAVNLKKTLDAMVFDDWLSTPEIAAKAGLTESTTKRYVRLLVDGGKIDETGAARWKKYRRIDQNGK